jgi:hypothetical protein
MASPIIDLSALEREFEDACLAGIPEVQRLGYNPTRFLQMVGEIGARETARRLMNAQQFPEGFSRLWELGRLDLTIEAFVRDNPRFWALFDPQTLTNCDNRLREVGYLQGTE